MLVCDMKSWRFEVVSELGDMCICGCRERAEDVHHLLTRNVKRFILETLNGVPVARECHARPAKILAAVEEKCPERYAWYQDHKNEVKSGVEQKMEDAA